MAFVFKSEKNLEYIPKKLNISNLYKVKEPSSQNKNKSAFVPFLSNSEKLFEKVKETPGPGQYNIQNVPQNYIHRQYIKKNIENYKDSLNDYVNLMNNFCIKMESNKTPGPGDYNPGENINFGAKVKKQNQFRNNLLLYQNDNLMRNMIVINNFENDNSISMKNSNNVSTISKIENMNTNTNFSKTKKMNTTNNKIFRKLLFTYSKIKEDDKSALINDKDSSYFNEIGFNSLNQTNNFNNSNSQLNLSILKKSNSTSNIFTKNMKTKIFRTIHDHIRIKELSEQKKLEMKAYLTKSNYYLENYLKSKIFSELPGPGYYFTKPPPASLMINKEKTKTIKKKINKKLISALNENNANSYEKIELVPEKPKLKKMPLTKTMYQLKNDIIKKDFEKVKEVYIRNKYNNIIDKLIKIKQLKDKENKMKSSEKQNNNKEIQEEGYPIKYLKYILTNKKKNTINFGSKEKRFIGHSGWENEIIKNSNPGPGHYEVDSHSISKNNKNIISSNIFKGLQIPSERKLFTDEIKDTNPPVGSYQSQYFNSIEFNNLFKNTKSLENPIKDGFQDIIKVRTKKRIENIKLNEKKINSMLGPSSYFNNYNTIDKNNYKKYKESSLREIKNNECKKKENKQKHKEDYEINEYRFKRNKWVKKTFNASFV